MRLRLAVVAAYVDLIKLLLSPYGNVVYVLFLSPCGFTYGFTLLHTIINITFIQKHKY
jgi:hypothetical protein